MKKVIFSITVLFMTILSLAQRGPLPTSFCTDFSEGSYTGEWYSLNPDQPTDTYIFNYDSGYMHVTYNKQDWYFIHWSDYGVPVGRPGIIKLANNPIIEFDFWTSRPIDDLQIDIEDVNKDVISQNALNIPSDTFIHLIFDYSSEINTLNDTITEIKIRMMDTGQGTLIIDNYKMGDCTDTINFTTPSLDDISDLHIPRNWEGYMTLTGIGNGGANVDSIYVGVFKFENKDSLLIKNVDTYYSSPNDTANVFIDTYGILSDSIRLVARVWTDSGSVNKEFYVHLEDRTDSIQPPPYWESPLKFNSITIGKLEAYPNPTTNYLYLTLPSTSSGNIKLYDNLGRILYNEMFINKSTIIIATNEYSTGIYHIFIQTKEKLFKEKIIIQ